MNGEWFRETVRSTEELAALIGTPSDLAIKKQLAELDRHMQTFIAESPFVLLGTVDREGRLDVSPRGDAPGVAAVLDEHTLLIPERAGNRRADSLKNIIETGRIGLLFLRPGMTETLRVNGRACVVRDAEVLASFSVQGKTPLVGVGVVVEECFLQCGKSLIRSNLWQGLSEVCPTSLPDFAEILAEQTRLDGQTVESLRHHIEESYRNRLY